MPTRLVFICRGQQKLSLPYMKRLFTTTATDAQLLESYQQGRDQRAFAEIVRRHRPMVLATTRRVLRCSADAEDACQATFFTLAKDR